MSSDAGFWGIPPEAFPMTTSTASNVVLDFHDGTDAINHEGVAASTVISRWNAIRWLRDVERKWIGLLAKLRLD